MVLEIVKYGHPSLRSPGRKIEKIDAGIRELAADMIETMTNAEGVGLAAQQVGRPVRLCVLDIRDVPKRPSKLRIGGKTVRPAEHMPMVLVNPEIELSGEVELGVEGCLSFPGVSADVPRPAVVKVRATGLDGERMEFEAEGLLSRAVQHEFDHLEGVLFIDRLLPDERQRVAPEIADIAQSGLR